MTAKLRVFVSSVQKELEDERLVVQNLVNTDPFLSAHCVPVLYELEPASPEKAIEGCLQALDDCQIYLLIVGVEYGSRIGDLSITHTEFRRAKENHQPVLAFIKGDRRMKREEGTIALLTELDGDGFKYKRFGNVIDLQREVRAALAMILRDQHGIKILLEVFADRVILSSPGLPPAPITLANLRRGKYRPCSRNPVLAQCLSYFHRIEERGSGFRRMREQMLVHGLEQPLIGTDTGYFQVIFSGPGDNLDRLRVPDARLRVTPAVEARLNERQRKILVHAVETGSVTTGWCMEALSVARDTAHRDLVDLVELGLLARLGSGRSAAYVLKEGGSE